MAAFQYILSVLGFRVLNQWLRDSDSDFAPVWSFSLTSSNDTLMSH